MGKYFTARWHMCYGCVYNYSEYLLVDPSSDEEIVMEGKLVVSMNAHQELCALQLAGGVAVLPNQVWENNFR